MKKIAVIGAGNVGGLAASRLLENNLGEVVLVDVALDLALAKAFDLEDARAMLKNNYRIAATSDFSGISGSDIVVVTAGMSRKPGMKREELLAKNARIIKEIADKIKKFAHDAICIMVTNPVDIMTYLCIKELNADRRRVFGMGVNLDTSRYANLISKKINKDVAGIKAIVLGAHGEGMLPLARLTTVEGKSLDTFLSKVEIRALEQETVLRGAQIVNLYGSGSAYFAPSAAILEMIKAVVNDEKHICGASVLLQGEYGISDVCLGIPVSLGKNGIEGIVNLDLNKEELSALQKSAEVVKANIKFITHNS